MQFKFLSTHSLPYPPRRRRAIGNLVVVVPHQALVRGIRVVAPGPQPRVHGEFLSVEHLTQAGVVRGRLPGVALRDAQPRCPRGGEFRSRKLRRQLGLDVPRVVVVVRKIYLFRGRGGGGGGGKEAREGERLYGGEMGRDASCRGTGDVS